MVIVLFDFARIGPRLLGRGFEGSHRIGPQREVTHPKRIRLMSSWSISARLSRNTSFASTWSTHLKPDSAAEEPRVLRRQRGHSQSQNPVRAFAIRIL